MPSIHGIDGLSNERKNIFVRLDLNVPMKDGVITDDTRILRSIGTIEELLSYGHRVFLASHFGRPSASKKKDEWSCKFSLKQLKEPLEKYLRRSLTFVDDCGGKSLEMALNTSDDQVFLLENLRFYPGELENDVLFSQFLAHHCHAYVNDAFSCCHRAHASVVGITEFLPSYGGRALAHELATLKALFSAKRDGVTTAIVGGSKVSSKLGVLHNLCQKFDDLILGGGIANTFLAAKGVDVGQSLYEKAMIPSAQTILKMSKARIHLPEDALCAPSLTDKPRMCDIDDIKKSECIFDIGKKTSSMYKRVIEESVMVLWNGPLGVFEHNAFAKGSVELAQYISKRTQQDKLTSIIGGGDSAALIKKADVYNEFTFVSTAGGAFLEWLEGKPLPGVIALQR